MFLQTIEVKPTSTASEIVKQDYRTAEVFQKYKIEYCCGSRWPLESVCVANGIDLPGLLKELNGSTRMLQLSNNLAFKDWSIDFLADYIINVHHHYLVVTLPRLKEMLGHFARGHSKSHPSYINVNNYFTELESEILPHIRQEEEIIFPYLRQVAHAYENKDSFAGLFVRALRKPVAKIMDHEHELLSRTIFRIRELTGNYTPPLQACISHRVVLSLLKDLDNDLVQHVYLENEILFPRVITMENELLKAK